MEPALPGHSHRPLGGDAAGGAGGYLSTASETPMPPRELTVLDQIRAELRWRCRNDPWYLDDGDELDLDGT